MTFDKLVLKGYTNAKKSQSKGAVRSENLEDLHYIDIRRLGAGRDRWNRPKLRENSYILQTSGVNTGELSHWCRKGGLLNRKW